MTRYDFNDIDVRLDGAQFSAPGRHIFYNNSASIPYSKVRGSFFVRTTVTEEVEYVFQYTI